jgi:sugar phosphate isomerase/epimerase
MNNRRNFLRNSGLGIAAAASLPLLGKAAVDTASNPVAEPMDFPIGFAGFSFVRFDMDKSIAMMKRMGVTNLSVKEFHLPLNSSQETIDAVKKKLTDAGINMYTVGVVYMKSKEAVDQAFDYARKCGVNMIVGVPNQDLLAYTEEKVKATNIKMAIHNHGPEDKLYPSPKDVYDRIKDMDPRMGLCIDIGHTFRAGVLPEKAVVEYKDRLFDLHIKDVTAMAKDAKVIEIGRGAINFPAFVKALRKIKYTGICSVEYEKDMNDPLAGMAESVGYFRGILKGA